MKLVRGTQTALLVAANYVLLVVGLVLQLFFVLAVLGVILARPGP